MSVPVSEFVFEGGERERAAAGVGRGPQLAAWFTVIPAFHPREPEHR